MDSYENHKNTANAMLLGTIMAYTMAGSGYGFGTGITKHEGIKKHATKKAKCKRKQVQKSRRKNRR